MFLHYIEGTAEWMPILDALIDDAINRKLKPADAIHLATAATVGVSDCHTIDEAMKKWSDLGFPVQDPWTSSPRLGI